MQPQQQYIPARAGWNAQKNPSDQTLTTLHSSNNSRGLSPIQDSPVELPTHISEINAPTSNNAKPSSDYYEDVDPRFAEPARVVPPPALPSSLMPGGFSSNPNLLSAPNSSDPNLPRTASYDDLPDGARSPAASEASHFTSVSQRPINPEWRPELGAAAGQFAPYNARRPLKQQDRILEANAENPDFALPGAVSGRGRGRGRGGGGGGGRGGAIGPPINQSRYPGGTAM